MKITVVGLGYVGMSNAVLLAQKNEVFAYDVDAERVAMVNSFVSPIVDDLIEKFLINQEAKRIAREPDFDVLENFKHSSLIRVA